jgi:hypothetical protein
MQQLKVIFDANRLQKRKYRRYDRFLTNEVLNGVRLVFVVMEIYGDDLYGGCLTRIDDQHVFPEVHVEEISAAEIAEQGYVLYDGPSYPRTALQ